MEQAQAVSRTAGSRRTVLVALVLMLAWATVAWLFTGWVAQGRIDREVERERQEARNRAQNVSMAIGLKLAQARTIVLALSNDPGMVAALSRFGPDATPSTLPPGARRAAWLADPVLGTIAQRLGAIAADTGIAALLLINSAGDCVASAVVAGLNSQTGTNYADREYFQAARAGRIGRQFLVGRVTNTYNLAYGVPVSSASGVLGAMTASIDVTDMTPLLGGEMVFVTDENGVVVLAWDRALRMATIPGAAVNGVSRDERERRYKTTQFTVLDLEPAMADVAPGLVRWQGHAPYLLASQFTPGNEMKVHVLRSLDELGTIRGDRLWTFSLLVLSGALAALLGAGARNYLHAVNAHRAELMRLNEELSLQARSDALTGCANRRRFIEVLELERQRAERYATPFCLLSLDLDHFKLVNDQYGHPCGDVVLRHVVELVQSSLRPTDLLGRMGGEEFCVLLPQTGAHEAGIIAGRIRATVEATPARWGAQEVRVTVSLGVAQWRAADRELADELLARSDEAMYAAKHAGRNRVVIAPQVPPDPDPAGMATPSSG